MTFQTPQENFWAGKFGDEYIQRNQSGELLASNISFFSRALGSAKGIHSCIEFGANIGMNLRALKLLYPSLDEHAVEINQSAATQLAAVVPSDNIYNESIVDFDPVRTWDLVLIKGVLIHISPDVLTRVYDRLFASCGRYILVAEYYNPAPVTISYRGHSDRLFKRDFAGELLDRFSPLSLVDYGFAYHRDNSFPQDDITWFLLERNSSK